MSEPAFTGEMKDEVLRIAGYLVALPSDEARKDFLLELLSRICPRCGKEIIEKYEGMCNCCLGCSTCCGCVGV